MKAKIVVIGGLAAGPAAAAKAKRTDPAADVVLFESGEHISYGICEIPYYIGKTVEQLDPLEPLTAESFEKEKGVRVRILHRAEAIQPAARILEVRNFEKGVVKEVRYDRLIVATGSRPRRLGLEGEQARNVFTVKSLTDAAALRKFVDMEHPSKAVIIGGGYIGMEMAEALTFRGVGVTILHRAAQPMWGLEDVTRSAVASELAARSVTFVPNATVTGFVVNDRDSVTSVKANGKSYDTDFVVVCIGVEPNVELATSAGIRRGTHGGIVTDQRQVTSIDGIYAAGDCCEVRNVLTNKPMYCPLATIAARQGRVAGENAAGGSAVFKGALRSVAVRVFSLEVARIGLSAGEAQDFGFDPVVAHIETNSRIAFFPGNQKVHVVMIADRRSGRILGANLFGKEGAASRANIVATAIHAGMTMDTLNHLDLIYSPPFSPLWDPVLIAGNELKKQMTRHEKPDAH